MSAEDITPPENIVENSAIQEEENDQNIAKRKRDDENENQSVTENEDANKKVKTISECMEATPIPVTIIPLSATPAQELVIIEVSQEKVGQIIGSKGMVITEIQQRSGARAHVNQDFPDGVNRQVNITGLPHQIKMATELINLIIEHGPTAIHVNSMQGGPTVTSVIECTQAQVGKIIGSGGGTIKELQSKSGAKIQIDQDFPPEVPRKINITGTSAAVSLGVQLIQSLMQGDTSVLGMSAPMGGMYNSPMGGMPNMMGGGSNALVSQVQMVGGEAKQSMGVPKVMVGKIIGRGGEIIGVIQKKSGARVTVDQSNEADCKVMMTGAAHTFPLVISMVNEILSGVNPSHIGQNLPMGGGGAGRGGMPYGMSMPQQAYGGMGMGMYGMPQQSFGAYGGGYAPQQMQQSSGAYGGMAGGYQAYGASAGAAASYGTQNPYGQPAQAVPVAAKSALPSAWTEHKTDDGIPYWHNATTGVSTWEPPKN